MTTVTSLLYQLAYYFPYYVILVLVPMVIRVLAERAMGIRPETFESRVGSILPLDMAYETAFRTIVLSALYYPLFEELIFRGLPYFFFGSIGVVVGSTVWVLMHPAWQLQYLSAYPLRKRLAFTATSTFYYACNAVFYSMMWVNDAGLAALIYHAGHNLWLTLADIIKESLPIPKFRFSRKEKEAEKTPITVKPMLAMRRKSPKPREKERIPEHPLHFVVKKSTSSLSEEAREAMSMVYVRKKEY